MDSSRQVIEEWRAYRDKLRQQMPSVFDSFRQVSEQVFQDGALSRKHKELMALAIAVKIQCKLVVVQFDLSKSETISFTVQMWLLIPAAIAGVRS